MRAGLFSSLSPEISEMTFKDYALRDYDENSGILESDWYNAQVELLRLSSETWGSGLIQIEEGDFSLMRWYEYTLTLEPGQTLKNAVTAPVYPAIDEGYTPSLYSYSLALHRTSFFNNYTTISNQTSIYEGTGHTTSADFLNHRSGYKSATIFCSVRNLHSCYSQYSIDPRNSEQVPDLSTSSSR